MIQFLCFGNLDCHSLILDDENEEKDMDVSDVPSSAQVSCLE